MSQLETNVRNEGLDEKSVSSDPVVQFNSWLQEAMNLGFQLPDAMTLATATKEGRPSARMVLLKGVDDRGFVFYTNYHSRKATELDENPFAALVFYWPQLDRQVRVEGTVTRIPAAESDSYFRTRPRDSQIGAAASPQSEIIESREVLEKSFRDLEKLYHDAEVERPPHWGGYRLKPQQIEFWKARPGRLHDRLLYELQGDGSWKIRRLAP